MASINTNMSANIAANSMTRNERSMSSTMERLSTGLTHQLRKRRRRGACHLFQDDLAD